MSPTSAKSARAAAAVLAFGLGIAACARPAGADVGQLALAPDESTPDSASVETGSEPSSPVLVFSGPVRYEDPHGVYEASVVWTQKIAHPDVAVELDAEATLRLAPVAGGADGADSPAEFTVVGELRYKAVDASCHSSWVGQRCGLSGVTDAAIVGTAVLVGTELTLTIDWDRFGQERAPGRPRIEVARWHEDGSKAAPLAIIELEETANALEAAGLVGRPFVLEIHRHTPLALRGNSDHGSGKGQVELIPAPKLELSP